MPRIGLVAALLACFAVRALFVVAFGGVEPEQDEAAYVRVASILVEHRTYTGMWGPGYPVWIAALDALGAGDVVALTRWSQVLLGVWTCYAVARLGHVMGGGRVALAAAWICALYVPLAGFAPMVFAETLTLALLVPALELVVRATKGDGAPPVAASVGAGLLLGACALTRESAIAFVPIIGAWLVFAPRERAWLDRGVAAALVVLAACCALAPWTVRNALVNDRFSPIAHSTFGSSEIGLNARDVNFEYVGLGEDPLNVPGDLRGAIRGEAPAPAWHGDKLGNWIDRARTSTARGLDYARAHPMFFVRSRAVELIDTLAPNAFLVRAMRRYELQTPLDRGPLRGLAILLAVLSFPVLALLAVRGALMSSGGMTIAVACATLAPAIVHGMTRYRVPMLPLLFVAAAVALTQRTKIEGRARITWALLTLALVLLWIPSLEPVRRAVEAAW